MNLIPGALLLGILSLCTAEQCSCPVVDNVALRGRSTQSQLLQGESGYLAASSNAIDGNHNPNLIQGSCSHTASHSSPWWRVDLLAPHRVNLVVITNRGDCCAERINGAEIRIGSSLENEGNSNPRCATIHSIPAGISRTYSCSAMEGRYVNVVIPGKKEYLCLCEVEVYAVPSSKDCCSKGCIQNNSN